jgi:hypothetical protein
MDEPNLNQKSSFVDSTLELAAGYPQKEIAKYSSEERSSLHLVGGAVVGASIFSAVNWGVAGATFFTTLSMIANIGIIAASALAGLGITVVLDRSFIRWSELNTVKNGWFKVILYGMFRIGIAGLIGAFTAQAVMPFLMKDELKSHALTMVEKSEETRRASLEKQFKLDDKDKVLSETGKSVNVLEQAAKKLPSDIQLQLDSASKCWVGYSNRKRSLADSGKTKSEISAILKSTGARCNQLTKSADTAASDYWTTTRKQLKDARDAKTTAQQESNEAKAIVNTKTKDALLIEQDSFKPTSAAVMASLLKSNPAAKIKWLMLTTLILLFELSPLLCKAFAGQSVIGRRLASRREETFAELANKSNRILHNQKTNELFYEMEQSTLIQALASPQLLEIFRNQIEVYLSTVAPMKGNDARACCIES